MTASNVFMMPNRSAPDSGVDLVASAARNTLAGAVDVLTERPEWRGVLAYDQLRHQIVFTRPPPWTRSDVVPRAVRDQDLAKMRHWFEEHLGLVCARQNITDAARIVAELHAFHPVRDYLAALEWDGVPRIDRWLEDYCAVVPSSTAHAGLVRSVARKFLLSCVARVMKPGCKVDTMLILEGRQGIGKSTALAALAGEGLFCDSAIDFGTKDACQTIQGVWIYELAELDAILRRETSVIKSFLSRASDRFRPPYGRAPETMTRSVVFAGTTNESGYLRDRTGHRRFWIVRCEAELDTSGLREVRDHLWAEARHVYESGEAWHLGAGEEALMREEHALRVEADPWEETIAAWVKARERVTMNEVLERALRLGAQGRNPRVTGRVSQILGSLGFEKRRGSALPRVYFYERRADDGVRLSYFK